MASMAELAAEELFGKLSPVWSRIFDVYVDHGEGAYLHGIHGHRLLDFTCGIGVTNTGHVHPRVVKAMQDQAAKLLHGQANIVIHQPMLRLVEQLQAVASQPLAGGDEGCDGRKAAPLHLRPVGKHDPLDSAADHQRVAH